MQILRGILLISPLLVLAAGSQNGEAQDAASPESADSSGIWLRQTIALKSDRDSPTATTLTVGASGSSVTVYFNGQQLVKGHPAAGNVLAFDVTTLVRNGNNCVAIAVSALDAASPAKAAAALQPPNPALQNPAQWKATTKVPPVGWQQTDFNDRDWKPADASVISADTLNGEVVNVAWTPAGGPSRVEQGFVRFRDGDHVLLIGGTFIERAQQYGHLECALNRDPATNVTFRNLGWSADTVFAESRGIFDTPEKGYERLVEHVRAEEPSVILLCYGQNEAMSFEDGEAGIARFKQQLKQLHADLSTTNAEIIFLTPHPFLAMPEPLPDPTSWNGRLKQYADAVRQTAESLDAHAVDLFTNFVEDMAERDQSLGHSRPLPPDLQQHPELALARNMAWTDNGMHWNDAGYRAAAAVVGDRVTGIDGRSPTVKLNLAYPSARCVAGVLRNEVRSPSPNVLATLQCRAEVVSSFPTTVVFKGSTSNVQVELSHAEGTDSEQILKSTFPLGTAADDARHFLSTTPEQYERLRALTVQKNELYFHRWRPQNITYLFGFRKHEQGNNASEIAMFDPLIDELEARIFEARQPQWQTITVRQVNDNN